MALKTGSPQTHLPKPARLRSQESKSPSAVTLHWWNLDEGSFRFALCLPLDRKPHHTSKRLQTNYSHPRAIRYHRPTGTPYDLPVHASAKQGQLARLPTENSIPPAQEPERRPSQLLLPATPCHLSAPLPYGGSAESGPFPESARTSASQDRTPPQM